MALCRLNEFNEIKESTTLISANSNRNFRIAGLVIDAQHRVTRTGRNFGSLTIEDFSGKTELMLWSDDYVRFQNYLEKGNNLLINGFFKQRYNSDQFEFKVTNISLLEMVKQSLTRQLEINIEPASVTKEFVTFIENNVRENPGKSSLRFNIYEPHGKSESNIIHTRKRFYHERRNGRFSHEQS